MKRFSKTHDPAGDVPPRVVFVFAPGEKRVSTAANEQIDIDERCNLADKTENLVGQPVSWITHIRKNVLKITFDRHQISPKCANPRAAPIVSSSAIPEAMLSSRRRMSARHCH